MAVVHGRFSGLAMLHGELVTNGHCRQNIELPRTVSMHLRDLSPLFHVMHAPFRRKPSLIRQRVHLCADRFVSARTAIHICRILSCDLLSICWSSYKTTEYDNIAAPIPTNCMALMDPEMHALSFSPGFIFCCDIATICTLKALQQLQVPSSSCCNRHSKGVYLTTIQSFLDS